MHKVAKGFAKAQTPFGPLSGHTHIEVGEQGHDSVIIDFRCGHTPVRLVVAGQDYVDFLSALLEPATTQTRDDLAASTGRLAHIMEQTA